MIIQPTTMYCQHYCKYKQNTKTNTNIKTKTNTKENVEYIVADTDEADTAL